MCIETLSSFKQSLGALKSDLLSQSTEESFPLVFLQLSLSTVDDANQLRAEALRVAQVSALQERQGWSFTRSTQDPKLLFCPKCPSLPLPGCLGWRLPQVILLQILRPHR